MATYYGCNLFDIPPFTDLDLLTVQSSDPSLVDIKVTEVVAGGVASDTNFRLKYGGVTSSRLSTTSSEEEVCLF